MAVSHLVRITHLDEACSCGERGDVVVVEGGCDLRGERGEHGRISSACSCAGWGEGER